jgi:mRNA interferase MazF
MIARKRKRKRPMAARIDRGEVWLVDLGYIAKLRPCLILSIPPTDADRALTTLIPSTTSIRTRFEVALDVPFLDRKSVFDAQNPMTTSNAKFVKRLGRLATEQMDQVEQAIRLWLGL